MYRDPGAREIRMKRSTDRILTSHAGSLARPLDLIEMLRARINGAPVDEAAFDARVKTAVAQIVREQAENGIDVVDDGELSKPMFADYIVDRIAGFEGENPSAAAFVHGDNLPEPLPAYAAWRGSAIAPQALGLREKRPMCVGPLSWKDRTYEQDIANLKAALASVDVVEAFLPSPSPGIIVMRIPNEYYKTEEEYLFAVAGVLRDEYRAIVDAGFVLQVDAPDAAMSWDRQRWTGLAEFRKALGQRIEALNFALQGIPEESVRFHVCWGNGEAPHVNDIELKNIVDFVLQVKAACYSIEASNPRHAHEWALWQDVKLPDGKALMPGVIDSVTLFVEHPELVAQRIVQYASIVGRENVIAGTDCGFGTGATPNPRVHPEVVLAKFRSMAEGARIASQKLWG
jgi:5-methyltetrahydropteroyltriglutamate--homocysteine methyltransferase